MKLSKEIIEACWNDVKVSRKDFKDKIAPLMESNLDFYYGKQWDRTEKETGLRHVVVNYSAANALIKFDSLTFRPPEFDVKPNKQSDAITPYKLSSYLNLKYVDSGAWDSSQAALLDCLILGTGCVMSGWNSGWVRPVPISDPLEELKQRSLDRSLQDGLEFFGRMGAPQAVPRVTGEEVEVVGEGPKVIHVPTESVIIDPRAKWHDWRDARFIGRLYVRSLEELKKNKSLDNTDKLKGTASFKATDNEFTQDLSIRTLPEDNKRSSCLLAEVWYRNQWVDEGFVDSRGRRYRAGEYPIRIIWDVSMPDNPLLVELWPYQFTNNLGVWQYPFDFIHNRPDPKSFWGISEMTIQQPQQMELNRARSQQLTRGEQLANVKFWARKGVVPGREKARLESSLSGILIEGNGETPPVPIMKPQLDGDTAQNDINSRNDMTVITGVDDQARGVPSSVRQTATEVQIQNEKSAPRGAKMQDKWEKLIADIGKKITQTCIFMDHREEDIPVQVPKELQDDQNGDVQYLDMEPDDMVDSNVTVVTGSTRQLDKQTQLQGVQAVLDWGSRLQILGSAQNPGEINTRYLIERIVDLSEAGDPERLFDVSAYQQQYEQDQQQKLAMMNGLAGGGGGPPEPGNEDQGIPPGGGIDQNALSGIIGQLAGGQQ